MKRIVTFLPILVLVCGVGVIVFAIREYRQNQQDPVVEIPKPVVAVAPDADTYSQQDQELVRQVFDQPETLDSRSSSNAPTIVATIAPASRPDLLSAQFQTTEARMPGGDEQVAASSQVQSFTSLRKDDVRNPNSEQNQAAVRSIMEKRQRRVDRLGMD